MKRKFLLFSLFFSFLLVSLSGIDRFPRPEFKTNYSTPSLTTVPARANFYDYIDVGILFVSLFLATWLGVKKRSRRGILILAFFSIVYFGFWRRGCVCSIGAIQNVVLALFNTTYMVPLTVIIFFLLPLVTALFWGRSFCSGVCPFGALQEVVALKPVRLPEWLNRGLGTLPLIYLAFGILFAVTGADFIICRFDPFVGFFRFGATVEMFIYGGILLLIGIFVARPYCRFLCPYGVLLGWISQLSGRHLTITPDKCIDCKLCENSCPVDAIKKPHSGESDPKRLKERRMVLLLIVLMPVFSILLGWGFSAAAPFFSRLHPEVETAYQVALEEQGQVEYSTLESDAFRASGKPAADLFARASIIRERFRIAGWPVGILLGFSIVMRYIGTFVRRKQEGYEPDKEACVSCGRCFASCPVEQQRKDKRDNG